MSGAEMEKSPLNSEENYDYDALFKEGEGRNQFAQKTAIGEFRNPRKFACVDWTFIIVSIISLLVVIALNIERFITFERTYNRTDNGTSQSYYDCDRWYCTADFIFTVCVTLNLVFCIFYCLDALFRERTFELLAFIGAAWVIAIYVMGNLIYNSKEERPITVIKYVRLGFVCVFVPLVSVLALIVHRNMGFLILNVIGSNKKLTRAYHVRSFFETLQFFHIEIMANVVVLAFGMNGGFISLAEKIILCLLLALLICVSIWGYISVTWESKLGSILWYVFMNPFLAYYIYKIIQVSLHWSEYASDSSMELIVDGQEISTTFITVAVALLIANILGIFAITLLVASMTVTITNFGLGLKDKAVPPFTWCVQRIQK